MRTTGGIILCLTGLVVYFTFFGSNAYQFGSKTNWDYHILNEPFNHCGIVAKSMGVELSVMVSSGKNSDDWDFTGIGLSRPSFANNTFHKEIDWPGQSDFDLDCDANEYKAVFIENGVLRSMKLAMSHTGGTDGAISTCGRDKSTQVKEFALKLASEEFVEIYMENLTYSGFETTRLGRWQTSSNEDTKKLKNFKNCVMSLN